MNKFNVKDCKEFAGYGKPFAWAVIVSDIATNVVYMGDYDRVGHDSPMVIRRRQREKYQRMSNAEIAESINYGRFIRYRGETKKELAKIAELAGGELLSGYCENGTFFTKPKDLCKRNS